MRVFTVPSGMLSISAESATQEDLNGPIGKGQSLDAIRRVAEWCGELGVPLMSHYIIGFPWETPAHVAATLDLAYVAAGILGGAISFGHHIWDHAAGAALIRAAGGIVTDLGGQPWTPASRSALAGAPGVHAEMMEIVKTVGAPEDYL